MKDFGPTSQTWAIFALCASSRAVSRQATVSIVSFAGGREYAMSLGSLIPLEAFGISILR